MKEFIVDGFLRGEAIKGTETMRRMHDVRSLLLFIAALALPGCCSDRPFHRPLAGMIAGRPTRPTARLLPPVPIHRTPARDVEQAPPKATVEKQPDPIPLDQSPVYEPSDINPPPVVEQDIPRTETEPDLPVVVDDPLPITQDPSTGSVINNSDSEEQVTGGTAGPPPTAPMDDVIGAEEGLPRLAAPDVEEEVIDVTVEPAVTDLPELRQPAFGDTSIESSSVLPDLPEPDSIDRSDVGNESPSTDDLDLPIFDLPQPNRGRKPRIPSAVDLPDSADLIDRDSAADVGADDDFPAFPLPDAASTDSRRNDSAESGSQSENLLNIEEIQHGTMMLWKSGFGPRRVDGPEGQLLGVELKRSGKAHIDDEGRLQVSQGAYVVDGLDFQLLELAKNSGELTVELVFSPARMRQQAPALIASFSSSHESRNFSIGQQGANLVFQLRTSETRENGIEPPLTLARLPQEIPVHVVVSYRSGRLLCLVNGVEMHRSTDVTGDFSNWEPQNLILGDEWNHDADWNGSVEQIQIQTRALNQAQAGRLFKAWSQAR